MLLSISMGQSGLVFIEYLTRTAFKRVLDTYYLSDHRLVVKKLRWRLKVQWRRMLRKLRDQVNMSTGGGECVGFRRMLATELGASPIDVKKDWSTSTRLWERHIEISPHGWCEREEGMGTGWGERSLQERAGSLVEVDEVSGSWKAVSRAEYVVQELRRQGSWGAMGSQWWGSWEVTWGYCEVLGLAKIEGKMEAEPRCWLRMVPTCTVLLETWKGRGSILHRLAAS